jgi:DNA end-binding protein Ku
VARSLWTGSISFGLVNVPVRLYSAIDEHKLHFNLLHSKDDSPIGYEKVCKKEDKPVPDDEIVKAFEYKKGEFVYVTDEDFDAAKADGYKTIEITDFVPRDDIDPIYYAKTYYVGPDEGAEKVYSLLVQAMERSGLTGIAEFVMRDQQHLGALRVREGVIHLEQLYYADEIRPLKEIKASKRKVDPKELEMASRLIDSFTTEWNPKKYKDTYRDELMRVIEAKRKGKEIHVPADVEEEEAFPDLITALRQSVETAKGGRRRTRAASRSSSANGDLDDLSKSELEDRARKAGIEGRSKMTKRELVSALKRAA